LAGASFPENRWSCGLPGGGYSGLRGAASGAEASAVLYSIIETAKANGLIPFDYLKYLLEELPGKPDDIDYLLPWNVVLAEKINGWILCGLLDDYYDLNP